MLRTVLLTGREVAEAVPPEIASFNYIRMILIVMSAVFMVLTIILIIQDRMAKQMWSVKINGKSRWTDRFISSAYKILKEFPFTKGYIEKLSYQYRLINPCDSKMIARKTVSSCMLSWCICLITFLLIYLTNPRLTTLITIAIAIVIADSEVVGRMAMHYNMMILKETQKMIANVEHNFYVQYRVDDALYRSMEGMNPIMKAAADQIYQILISDDKETALREYYENVPNKYLRTFVSQCIGVMERGDQTLNGKMLYIQNMEYLQREIDIEIEKHQRLEMEFMGVIACVVAPIFFIDFVKQFAIDIKENMEIFFYGKEGFLCDIGILAIISCIYIVMRKSAEYIAFRQSYHRWLITIDRIPVIKKAMDNYCDTNATKQERLKKILRNNGNNIRPRHFILRNFMVMVLVFVIGIGITISLHDLSKKQLLRVEISEIEILTSSAKKSHYEEMGQLIEEFTHKYVDEFKKGKITAIPQTQEQYRNVLQEEGSFNNIVINTALAGEIMRRVDQYQKEHFSFLDLVICLVLSIIAYHIPGLMLKFNSLVSKDAMEDEVNQFNALIGMLMYIDSMSVKQILEEMESFAVIFKESLRTCINNYSSGDMHALEELKESEPYEPFKRIVENLMRCDDIPIHQAFHEVDVEREGYMGKRKLNNEKSIKKRVARAYLLAMIPMIVLLLYGILPPLVSSMEEIDIMMEELESTY